jgi:uncharacterized protein YjbI with pentapeptide repeats
VGGVFVVVALLWAVVYVPELAIDPRGLNQTDWLTHVERLRAALLQGLGGLGALVAVLSTFYFGARTLGLNRRGQLTERFGKAIEQLGSDSLALRLGGIFALEQIALDSEELHWPVMEVLTAFLRDNSATHDARQVVEALEAMERGHPIDSPPDTAGRRQPKLAADLQAIATVIGRRPEHRRRFEQRSGRELDLSEVWLPKVQLVGAHLEGANLADAHLEWACLAGASLRGANLECVHLHEANLKRAHLEDVNFWGANLAGVEFGRKFPVLQDADADGAHLAGAAFMGANLAGASLRGTDVTADQIGQGYLDENTVLPSTLNLDELLQEQRELVQ